MIKRIKEKWLTSPASTSDIRNYSPWILLKDRKDISEKILDFIEKIKKEDEKKKRNKKR